MRFLRYLPTVTKKVKSQVHPPLPSPSEEKCSTTNIVSWNKAEVQSVEISWSKRFLHSLCWVVCLTLYTNMEFVLNAISWTHDSSQEKFILVIKFSCSKCLEVLEETNLSTLILLRNVESLADCTDKHSVGSDIDLNQTRVFEFY